MLPPSEVDRQFVELPVEPTVRRRTGSVEWDLGEGALDESSPATPSVPVATLLPVGVPSPDEPDPQEVRNQAPERYCGNCGEEVSHRSKPSDCPQCGTGLFE